jgi:hypothetical protein
MGYDSIINDQAHLLSSKAGWIIRQFLVLVNCFHNEAEKWHVSPLLPHHNPLPMKVLVAILMHLMNIYFF